MIFTDIKNLDKYKVLHPNLSDAINYIKSQKWLECKVGKNDIDGDRLFIMHAVGETKSDSEGFWESHKKYIDIQFAIEGQERINYSSIDNAFKTEAFDAEKDFQGWTGEFELSFRLTPNLFAIFFPEDIHMTGLHWKNNQANFKKYIIKVLI